MARYVHIEEMPSGEWGVFGARGHLLQSHATEAEAIQAITPEGRMRAVRHRKFKEQSMQSIYDQLRASPPSDPDAAAGKGGIHSAYRTGFRHPTLPARYVRNSHAYAGWAAGVDNAELRMP